MSGGPVPDADDAARRLGAIAVEAGRLLAVVAERTGGYRLKEDGSPATDADLASERLILDRLAEAWPGIPVLAEESARAGPVADLFFLVDPLDGTKDFLSGHGEYSVNIALVSAGRPVAAALASPVHGRVWIAGERAWAAGMSAEPDWRAIAVRPSPPGGLVALVSRRHGDADTEACLSAMPRVLRETVSSAAKFGLIASGEADLYVRCGPTMEWDTAAGDHIVTRAGGLVVGPDGAPLRYGRAEAGFRNGAFAAFGDACLAKLIQLKGA